MLPKVPVGPRHDPAFVLVALVTEEAGLPGKGRDSLATGPTSDHSSRRASPKPVTELVYTMLLGSLPNPTRTARSWKVELLTGAGPVRTLLWMCRLYAMNKRPTLSLVSCPKRGPDLATEPVPSLPLLAGV